MATKQQLQEILNDFTSHTCKEIHLIWTDGRKDGIGNKDIINKVMTMLINELKSQIAEYDKQVAAYYDSKQGSDNFTGD